MYSFEQLIAPIWASDVIYDEALTMVRSKGIAKAPLLFEPGEILLVTSADKTMEYEEGVDWELKGGMLQLTSRSRIFAFEEEELVFDEEKPGECFPTKDGRYSLFHEGHYFHDRQISVTYRKKSGTLDFAPSFCGILLPKTMEKLCQKETVKIVLYGDSIAAGANSSGATLTTPFLPKWGDLLQENLKRHYGTNVELFNPSVPGMNSYWGIENAKTLVGDYKPDLAIIAFGMNDSDEAWKFVENTKLIMEKILETSPETEFILCATTVPNSILENFYKHQGDYGEALKTLESDGIAIADFGRMHQCMMEQKRFIDMTGNNVNHPNDFLIRCHAQLLSTMLIKRKKEV